MLPRVRHLPPQQTSAPFDTVAETLSGKRVRNMAIAVSLSTIGLLIILGGAIWCWQASRNRRTQDRRTVQNATNLGRTLEHDEQGRFDTYAERLPSPDEEGRADDADRVNDIGPISRAPTGRSHDPLSTELAGASDSISAAPAEADGSLDARADSSVGPESLRSPEVLAFSNRAAKTPYGPWLIPFVSEDAWLEHEYLFHDLLSRIVPVEIEKAGGTLGRVIERSYIMKSLNLRGTVSSGGLKIEWMSDERTKRKPMTALLSYVAVRRTGLPRDLVIWFRPLFATASGVEETETGFRVAIETARLPPMILTILEEGGAACKATFPRLKDSVIAKCTATTAASGLILDLHMDESTKDSVWEDMAREARTPGSAQHASGDVSLRLFQAVKRRGTSIRRFEALEELLIGVYEDSLANANRFDPKARAAETRLDAVASFVLDVLTEENRMAQARISRKSGGRTRSGSQESRQLRSEIDTVRQLRSSRRRAFFEHVFSKKRPSLSVRLLDRIARSNELEVLAKTAVPVSPAAGKPPSPAEPVPEGEFLPERLAVCSPVEPHDDIIVVFIEDNGGGAR